jgi:hypothetical protein
MVQPPNPALWAAARADAPPAVALAAATVDLAAQDSNDVEISNPPDTDITISSFGSGVPWMRIKVKFVGSKITVNIPAVNKLYYPGNVSIFRALADGSWYEEVVVTPGGGGPESGYTSSQTIKIIAPSAKIKMWGGSAGSNGVELFDNSFSGAPLTNAATGAGSYLEKSLSGLVPGQTLTFTFGAKGHGGNCAFNNGNPVTAGGAGGNSILASGTQTISTLTAGGSPIAPFVTTPTGGLGGVASGGDININGQIATVDAPGSTMYSSGARSGHLPPPGGTPYAYAYDGTDGGLIIKWG